MYRDTHTHTHAHARTRVMLAPTVPQVWQEILYDHIFRFRHTSVVFVSACVIRSTLDQGLRYSRCSRMCLPTCHWPVIKTTELRFLSSRMYGQHCLTDLCRRNNDASCRYISYRESLRLRCTVTGEGGRSLRRTNPNTLRGLLYDDLGSCHVFKIEGRNIFNYDVTIASLSGDDAHTEML
jgi:hypothetical protein